MSRALSTKTARFRLAVSAGFVIAAAGVTTMAFQRTGSAEGMWGMMDLFGGGQASAPQVQAQYDDGSMSNTPRHHKRHHGDRARNAKYADSGDQPVNLSQRSMCVRLCDGFAFPVGDYHGEQDRPAHEATCRSECPGAQTALYVLPAGSDSIGDAVRVGTGKNYSALPDAFHYTTVLDESCSCHPAAGNRVKSLLHDFTLRRGDAVMTSNGVKVFHGAGQFPYRQRDFVALNRTRDLRAADRVLFKSIERASLPTAKTLAQQQKPPPQPVARDEGTKRLEHQASR